MSSQLLEIRDLKKDFWHMGKHIEVLKGLELDVSSGEMCAIVGASGAGKSTFLHVVGTLDAPTSGIIRVNGKDVTKLSAKALAAFRNKTIGFVFQFHHLLPEFTAVENVAQPLWVAQVGRREALDQAGHLLGELGMSERAMARPDELSGGERQRVAMARALVTGPVVVLADEPTGNLDGGTARRVYERMMALTHRLNTAVVIATHDLELAAQTDRVLRLRDGRLGPTSGER